MYKRRVKGEINRKLRNASNKFCAETRSNKYIRVNIYVYTAMLNANPPLARLSNKNCPLMSEQEVPLASQYPPSHRFRRFFTVPRWLFATTLLKLSSLAQRFNFYLTDYLKGHENRDRTRECNLAAMEQVEYLMFCDF